MISMGINVVPHFHMMDELMWFRESGAAIRLVMKIYDKKQYPDFRPRLTDP
jgi:hypothetical protein